MNEDRPINKAPQLLRGFIYLRNLNIQQMGKNVIVNKTESRIKSLTSLPPNLKLPTFPLLECDHRYKKSDEGLSVAGY